MNCHMHQGNLLRESLSSATRGGIRRRTASTCIRRSSTIPTDDELVRATVQNPEAAAARGLWGNQRLSREGRGAESEAEAHAVRRLPRPRLGLPRGLQEGPKRATCSTSRTRSSRTATSRTRGASQGHPPRKRECSAWTAISTWTCTATACSTASRATPRRSCASIATARSNAAADADDERRRRPTGTPKDRRKIAPVDLAKIDHAVEAALRVGGCGRSSCSRAKTRCRCVFRTRRCHRRVGGAADDRRDRSGLAALQREGALREDAAARRRRRGATVPDRREECAQAARAQQRNDGLPDLPHARGRRVASAATCR